MTRVYFIRHAEAEGNLHRVAQGHLDGKITQRGYQQIAALSKRFEDIHVDAVYASDLLRTRTTAEAVYVPKNLPLHTSENFREIFMGDWEGQPWQVLYDTEPEQIDAFNNHPQNWHPHGGETPYQVVERFTAKLNELVAKHDGQTIVIVSHGCALRFMLAMFEGVGIEGVGSTMHGDNTCVSLVEFTDGKTTVIFRDDNSHLLEADLSTLARQDWWRKDK